MPFCPWSCRFSSLQVATNATSLGFWEQPEKPFRTKDLSYQRAFCGKAIGGAALVDRDVLCRIGNHGLHDIQLIAVLLKVFGDEFISFMLGQCFAARIRALKAVWPRGQ